MTVLLASNNPGKLRELAALLRGSQLELKSPAEAGVALPRVAENGATFKDNALIKARALSAASGQWALADDSGIEVDVLGGAPGVRSSRFGGEGASDERNNAKLLKILRSARKRKARFRCVLALVKPGGQELTAEGILEGEIVVKPRGENGFGYDPLFVVPGTNRTLAEMSFEEKLRISHRAKAAQRLLQLLPGFQAS